MKTLDRNVSAGTHGRDARATLNNGRNGRFVRRNKIFNLVARHRNVLLGFNPNLDADAKLLELSKGVGLLAQTLDYSEEVVTRHLQGITAWVLGWTKELQQGGERDCLVLVFEERERQDEMLRKGKFLYNCASAIASPRRKLRVLLEEIGEVAEAIDKLEMVLEMTLPKAVVQGAKAHLRTELIQVAAVCVAWLEALRAESRKTKRSRL
jgi:hypothetical protein